MASIEQDIILFKHRYHVIQFTVDGVTDLIGYGARWTISETPGSTPFTTKSTEGTSPKITIDGLKILVVIDEGDLTTATAGEWYHELTIIDDMSKLIQGAVGVADLRDVTITTP